LIHRALQSKRPLEWQVWHKFEISRREDEEGRRDPFSRRHSWTCV